MSVRRVLVTGAAGELARAVLPIVARGASHLALVDRDPVALARAAARVRQADRAPFVAEFPADLSQDREASRIAREAMGFAGMVDELVHLPSEPDPDSALIASTSGRSLIEGHLLAAVTLTLAVRPAMVASRRGSVVLVGAGLGAGGSDRALLAAVRGGLAAFVRAVAAEGSGGDRPTIGGVLAGPTPSTDHASGRDVASEDVAAAVALLLGPDADRFDGAVLTLEAPMFERIPRSDSAAPA